MIRFPQLAHEKHPPQGDIVRSIRSDWIVSSHSCCHPAQFVSRQRRPDQALELQQRPFSVLREIPRIMDADLQDLAHPLSRHRPAAGESVGIPIGVTSQIMAESLDHAVRSMVSGIADHVADAGCRPTRVGAAIRPASVGEVRIQPNSLVCLDQDGAKVHVHVFAILSRLHHLPARMNRNAISILLLYE